MKGGKPLNSWGAKATTVEELESGPAIDEYQVTTDNVDEFKWKENVTFYL